MTGRQQVGVELRAERRRQVEQGPGFAVEQLVARDSNAASVPMPPLVTSNGLPPVSATIASAIGRRPVEELRDFVYVQPSQPHPSDRRRSFEVGEHRISAASRSARCPGSSPP